MKMQEEYAQMTKKLKEEYEDRVRSLEQMIERQQRQIQDQHFIIVCERYLSVCNNEELTSILTLSFSLYSCIVFAAGETGEGTGEKNGGKSAIASENTTDGGVEAGGRTLPSTPTPTPI